MTIHFLSDNVEQNEEHQKLLTNYSEGLVQPELVYLGNFEAVINGEEDPIYDKCDANCEKCKNNQFDFDEAVFIPARWGSNYSHFLLEVLPKMMRVNAINPNIRILIYLTNAFVPVINYFKISNPITSLGCYTATDQIFHAKNSYIYESYHYYKTTIEDLSLIRSYVSIKEQGDICVLIRRRERCRHVLNFDKLYESLRNNFPNETWVVFEIEPFHEMLKMFTRAKLIICPHGAGTANAVFSPQNVSIIEVYPDNWIRPAFFWFTQNLKMNHYLYSANLKSFKFDIDKILQTTYKILKKDD